MAGHLGDQPPDPERRTDAAQLRSGHDGSSDRQDQHRRHRGEVPSSNELGTTPLVIGSASIALVSSGLAIVPGSDQPLTFSGLSFVTIPPGAPMLSDPVKLHVPPLSDLAVSIYLPAGRLKALPFTT